MNKAMVLSSLLLSSAMKMEAAGCSVLPNYSLSLL